MAKKRRYAQQSSPSKKKKAHPEAQRKAVFRKIIIAVGLILILVGIFWTFIDHSQMESTEWKVNENGIMSYPTKRGTPVFESVFVNFTSSYSIELINYSSRDRYINGLLTIPNRTGPVPGVLILPGAGVPKEGIQGLITELTDMGYASMVIDQRNQGGVDITRDIQLFSEGIEPVEHKMVLDALRAVDVMKQFREIDSENIAIIGISNGGRFAIIAAAIDPSIKGVVGISTSGYDTESYINEFSGQIPPEQIRFLRSIDPDSYLDMLPPGKLVMIHMKNDTVIPIELAQKTHDRSGGNVIFYPLEGNGHGYNAAMKPLLEFELNRMFADT